MKKYPSTKHQEARSCPMTWLPEYRNALAHGEHASGFGFRHSFVLGHFVIRHRILGVTLGAPVR
jgi:hypothetical protein